MMEYIIAQLINNRAQENLAVCRFLQRFETTQVGLNGDDWVYASVRVRGLTRFHVALGFNLYCRRGMEMGGRPCEGRGMRD